MALMDSMALNAMRMVPMDWDMASFLKNSASTLKTWGGLLFVVIGVIMIIFGVVKIAIGLINHGKTQVSWVVNIVLIILGGAIAAGGWQFVYNIASGGQKTIEDLGKGSGTTTAAMLQWMFR